MSQHLATVKGQLRSMLSCTRRRQSDSLDRHTNEALERTASVLQLLLSLSNSPSDQHLFREALQTHHTLLNLKSVWTPTPREPQTRSEMELRYFANLRAITEIIEQ